MSKLTHSNPADNAGSGKARATLVVTPRERFGVSLESLQSIIEYTSAPFELIYVDAGSPKETSTKIGELCRAHGFNHLRREHFLSPNQSRNIGYRAATTPYVVFIDNDVVVSADWLEALIACADETGADVVTPLTCQKRPVHTEIHQAGGRFAEDVEAFFSNPPHERRIDEEELLQGKKVSEVTLRRSETQCCEFHCALVRRDTLERQGGLDEKLLGTKEHLDFCMTVWRDGGKVMLEPSSVVTYLFPNRSSPLMREDWRFFTLRWSPTWQKQSLDHFKNKWGLVADPYFQRRDEMLSWRHREGIAKPIVRKIPVIGGIAITRRLATKVFTLLLEHWSRSLAATQSCQVRRRA